MGRLRTETIQIDPALLRRTPAGVELTPAILLDYGARMRAQGRREDSVRSCEPDDCKARTLCSCMAGSTLKTSEAGQML